MGMQYSGHINESRLLLLLENMHSDTAEIVMHPGYESIALRKGLPWAYSTFDWDSERSAIQSEKVKSYIQDNHIELINFSGL